MSIHTFTRWAFAIALLFVLSTGAQAQVKIWGCSPFQDSMWSVDTTSLQVINRMGPTFPGFTITGINGMAFDPVNHETYVIMKISGVTGRVLGKMDLSTGVCTQVGNLGDNFSSISFRKDGQLFGVTGDGATVPETMYLIDKTNATKTVAVTLGNGADGEVISYNDDDDFFYHWSGNSTVVFEKIMAQAPYTTTSIPFGTGTGETFGALYLGNDNFYTSNISSNFIHRHVSGAVSASFASLPDDLRGLVIEPVFTFNEDSVCQRVDTLSVSFTGILQDTVTYAWGDGTTDVIFPAGGASHTYSSAGLKTVHVILNNPYLASPDTFMTYSVQVVNAPNVTISANPQSICDGNAVTLTGSAGGQSQWFVNGVLLPGANSATYSTTSPGIYNLLKTNQNGCSDSAATGTLVMEGTTPAAFWLGPDSTVCVGSSACFGLPPVSGLNYAWNSGDTTAIACFGIAGSYILTISDSAGCATADTIEVYSLAVPAPTMSIDTSLCPDITFTITDPSGVYWDVNYGNGTATGSPNPVSTNNYTWNGTFTVVFTGTNACGSTTDSTQITITCGLDAVDNALQGRVSVYPNPFDNQVNIVLDIDVLDQVELQLRDLTGKLLQTETHSGMVQILEFKPQAELPAGTYLLTVKTSEGNATIRIVK